MLTLWTIQAQVQSLKGTWVLKDIKSQDSKERSVSTVKEVPAALYYTCPDKITFEEEERVCTLHYKNGEEKKAHYLLKDKESSIYFSMQGKGSVPEKQFSLQWNREGSEGEQEALSFLQLQYSKKEEQYIYNYQLQK